MGNSNSIDSIRLWSFSIQFLAVLWFLLGACWSLPKIEVEKRFRS